MITQEKVWQDIWPVVESLISGTLAEDEAAIRQTLWTRGEAAQLYEMFGHYVFDILLKTVLGRGNLSVTRAIETDNGKFVHIEYVWPDPDAPESYTAADLVTVKLRRYRKTWRVVAVNPAALDFPLTEARAAGILANTKELTPTAGLPAEPWILPIALYGGALQITLREAGLKDEVERTFLTGMQAKAYGVLSLMGAQRLWRDFQAQAPQSSDRADGETAAWAAAVAFIASEQALRQQTQAAVAQTYGVSLVKIAPRVRHIKEVLHLTEGLDERYTAVQSEQIVLQNDSDGDA
ncbi:MAG: hypothetical protein KDD89_05300 [Anaerolineales bacterium]|nr:hypothetical protein [Anaerolineales bacterium]